MPARNATSPDPKPVGRPRLPTERIITAALGIVDARGAEALTLRALADTLGSSTATLYRHVENREALLDLVIERVFDEIDIDEALLDDLDWIPALAHLGTAMFTAVARHPNAAPLLIGRVPTGPNAMRLRETCLSRLLANGFTPEEAQALTASFGRSVIGYAIQAQELLAGGIDPRTAQRLVNADPSLYPATRSSATARTVPIHDEFDIAVDLMLRGLRDLASDPDRRARTRPDT
jgi:AcrR family transcriptional regulator